MFHPYRKEGFGAGRIPSQDSAGLELTDYGFLLQFTQHAFTQDSLSNYFKLTRETFPLLMMNPCESRTPSPDCYGGGARSLTEVSFIRDFKVICFCTACIAAAKPEWNDE